MPSSPATVEQVRGRARSYWRVDGIPWLVRGLQAMCWAFAIFLLARGPHSSFYSNLAVLAALCLDRGAILFLKSRVITYPRTGYVAPPPQFHATNDDFVLLRLNDGDFAAEPASPGRKLSLVGVVALVLSRVCGFSGIGITDRATADRSRAGCGRPVLDALRRSKIADLHAPEPQAC